MQAAVCNGASTVGDRGGWQRALGGGGVRLCGQAAGARQPCPRAPPRQAAAARALGGGRGAPARGSLARRLAASGAFGTRQESLDALTTQLLEKKKNLTSIMIMLDAKKSDRDILKKRKHSTKETVDKFAASRKDFERRNKLPFFILPGHINYRENLASEAYHQYDTALKKWQGEIFDLRQRKQSSKVRIFKISQLRAQVKERLKGDD